MTTKATILNQGVAGSFVGVSNEHYHKEALWAYSSSDCQAALLSTSNVIQKRKIERKITPAMLFGTMLHARMEHFDNEQAYLDIVAVPPKVDKRTTEGKAAHAAFEKTVGSKLLCDEKTWDILEGCLAAVQAHPDANSLLTARGIAEESFIWQDEETGVWCKCRPDKRITEAPMGLPDDIIIDWKTTDSCDKRDMETSIANYNYHLQAAFYLDGISKVLGRTVGPFVNVFIEKGGSNRVVLGVLSESSLERGRVLYKSALRRIAESQATGVWGGFVDLSLPAWAA